MTTDQEQKKEKCYSCGGKGTYSQIHGVHGADDFGGEGFDEKPTIHHYPCKACNGTGFKLASHKDTEKKCEDCLAHNISENHICDGLMKMLVDNHKKNGGIQFETGHTCGKKRYVASQYNGMVAELKVTEECHCFETESSSYIKPTLDEKGACKHGVTVPTEEKEMTNRKCPHEAITPMKDKILKIIEWYGHQVDPQGWEIEERHEAVVKILEARYQAWREAIVGNIEVHTHNSIPNTIDELSTGCIICIKNHALKTLLAKMSLEGKE